MSHAHGGGGIAEEIAELVESWWWDWTRHARRLEVRFYVKRHRHGWHHRHLHGGRLMNPITVPYDQSVTVVVTALDKNGHPTALPTNRVQFAVQGDSTAQVNPDPDDPTHATLTDAGPADLVVSATCGGLTGQGQVTMTALAAASLAIDFVSSSPVNPNPPDPGPGPGPDPGPGPEPVPNPIPVPEPSPEPSPGPEPTPNPEPVPPSPETPPEPFIT